MGIFDWFKKKKVVKKETTQEPKTPKQEKNVKEVKVRQPGIEGILNTLGDNQRGNQSNKEKKLEITINDVKYQVADSETIRKIKNLNDPKSNKISTLFSLKEYYDNGNIKKETEKDTASNCYIECFFDETGNKTKEDWYHIKENRLGHENIYDDGILCQNNKYYEGGEIRQSLFVDGLQEGIEKVFDKEGNLVEEHTYKRGRNTYYKRFIEGKVSEESVMEEELKEEEEEIMRIANSIVKTSSFVTLGALLPADLSEFEGDTFYDVTEQYIVLLKNGKKVASGYVCISHNANYWDDEGEEHDDIQSHNEVMIVNGKLFTDYDDEKRPGWKALPSKTKRIATFWDDGEAEEFFNEYVKIKCKENN